MVRRWPCTIQIDHFLQVLKILWKMNQVLVVIIAAYPVMFSAYQPFARFSRKNSGKRNCILSFSNNIYHSSIANFIAWLSMHLASENALRKL